MSYWTQRSTKLCASSVAKMWQTILLKSSNRRSKERRWNYIHKPTQTQTVHTCGVSVWVLRANVIHLAVSMRIEILYLYDFSFLFCSLHAMYMVVLSIRERSYVLWSLFIKRLHTNGNSQPKPYTVLWLWHAFSFSFSLCVYTCARIVMNKRLDDISSVFSYHLFHILLRLEWLQIFVHSIWMS